MNEEYINRELANYASGRGNHYRHAYHLKRLKRLLVQSLIAFFCQFTAILYVSLSLPPPPLYPPLGVAFALIYLFGANVLPALSAASFVAYALKGVPAEGLLAYVSADIVIAYLGVILCQNCFATDNPWSYKRREWAYFIGINLFMTALMSSLLRLLPWYSSLEVGLFWQDVFSLWLASSSAILIIFGFLIIWLYVVYSRGSLFKVSVRTKIPLLMTLFAVLMPSVLIKTSWFMSAMGLSMLLSLYLAYRQGIILATALSYLTSLLYFAYAMVNKVSLLQSFGVIGYGQLSLILFLYSVLMLLVSV